MPYLDDDPDRDAAVMLVVVVFGAAGFVLGALVASLVWWIT